MIWLLPGICGAIFIFALYRAFQSLPRAFNPRQTINSSGVHYFYRKVAGGSGVLTAISLAFAMSGISLAEVDSRLVMLFVAVTGVFSGYWIGRAHSLYKRYKEFEESYAEYVKTTDKPIDKYEFLAKNNGHKRF